jgi:hypothetical protein
LEAAGQKLDAFWPRCYIAVSTEEHEGATVCAGLGRKSVLSILAAANFFNIVRERRWPSFQRELLFIPFSPFVPGRGLQRQVNCSYTLNTD